MFKYRRSRETAPELGEIEVTVCPVHLRFVPCRRCKPGEEKYSTDPADVERTRRYQQG